MVDVPVTALVVGIIFAVVVVAAVVTSMDEEVHKGP